MGVASDNCLGSGVLTVSPSTEINIKENIDLTNNMIFPNIGTANIKVDEISYISGTASGIGGFAKTGKGLLVINGSIASTGENYINEGKVKVVGSVDAGFQVASGATLLGFGIVGPIQMYGNFIPGCSSTTIVTNGALSFLGGSKTTILVDEDSNGFIQNNGDTTFSGKNTVFFQLQKGYRKLKNTFAILEASDITGLFSQALSSSAAFDASVYVLHNIIYANLNLVDFGLKGDKNARHIGRALMTLFKEKDSQIYPIIDDLIKLQPGEDIGEALEQMNLSYYKGLTVQQENNAVLVQDTINYRIEKLLNGKYCYSIKPYKKSEPDCGELKGKVNVWVDGFTDFLTQGNDTFGSSSQAGYGNSTWGVTLGINTWIHDEVAFGLVGAYSSSSLRWNQSRANGDIPTGYGGVYLSYVNDYFYTTASVVGAWNSFYAKRVIEFPGVYEKATSNRGGTQLSSQLNVGVNLDLWGVQFRPFDSFEYISQVENGFSETGAGAYDLTVGKSNSIMMRNELGLQLAHCFCFNGSSWTIAPQVSWVREIRVRGSKYYASFVGTNEVFNLTGYFPDRSLISPGVLVTKMFWKNKISMDLYYKGQFGHKFSDNSFGAQFRLGF